MVDKSFATYIIRKTLFCCIHRIWLITRHRCNVSNPCCKTPCSVTLVANTLYEQCFVAVLCGHLPSSVPYWFRLGRSQQAIDDKTFCLRNYWQLGLCKDHDRLSWRISLDIFFTCWVWAGIIARQNYCGAYPGCTHWQLLATCVTQNCCGAYFGCAQLTYNELLCSNRINWKNHFIGRHAV